MTLTTQFVPKKFRKEILVGRLNNEIGVLEEIVRQREQVIEGLAKVIREMKMDCSEKDRHPFRTFIRRLRIRWLGSGA